MLLRMPSGMSKRTSLILDDDTRIAARQLALRYDCSTSEAIRRAVVRHRDAVLGVPAASDPEAEVQRLKDDDSGS